MLNENDHRSLGDRLDLFHMQEEAPGMVFWHPRGFILYQLLEQRVRRELAAGGYREVRTPQILGQRIWESSGHWQNFRGDMFVVPSWQPLSISRCRRFDGLAYAIADHAPRRINPAPSPSSTTTRRAGCASASPSPVLLAQPILPTR